jgi:glycine/D-amino acid oxidase-like deaminating enzyme
LPSCRPRFEAYHQGRRDRFRIPDRRGGAQTLALAGNPEIKAGAFRAKDGWFSAHEVTQGFARAADKARFYVRTRATGIETDDRGVCA